MAKLTEKEAGKSYLGKQRRISPVYTALVKSFLSNSLQRLLLSAACRLHLLLGQIFFWRYVCRGDLVNIQDKWVLNIVAWYCSGYGFFENKFFSREKWRENFSRTYSSPTFLLYFSLVRTPLNSTVNSTVPPNSFRMSGVIGPNNNFSNV